MNEDELQHWGILKQKWGLRRFQNEDGSLTEEGRIRYGVGPARKTTKGLDLMSEKKRKSKTGSLLKKITRMIKKYKKKKEKDEAEKIAKGNKDYQKPDGSLTFKGQKRYGATSLKETKSESLSDDEIRAITRRYKAQSEYYKARNEYFYQQQEYQKYINKPNPIGKFASKYFGRPLGNALEKSMEFGFLALGASIVDAASSKYYDDYVRYVFRGNKNNNPNDNSNNHGKNH